MHQKSHHFLNRFLSHFSSHFRLILGGVWAAKVSQKANEKALRKRLENKSKKYLFWVTWLTRETGSAVLLFSQVLPRLSASSFRVSLGPSASLCVVFPCLSGSFRGVTSDTALLAGTSSTEEIERCDFVQGKIWFRNYIVRTVLREAEFVVRLQADNIHWSPCRRNLKEIGVLASKTCCGPSLPKPTLFKLMMMRFSRNVMVWHLCDLRAQRHLQRLLDISTIRRSCAYDLPLGVVVGNKSVICRRVRSFF